ncbi:amidase [Agrococcus carbonis]|uniref:Amidase n=1 Tax=Agrococcus carbonis TaxID=684552 RepID=A0A1H1LVH9_9MICO|nr:amidase [Agrococcus carbonis]SDR78427.1 amidase [Agrococcus carbonis]
MSDDRVFEASAAALRAALDAGETTAVELAARTLARVGRYDVAGPRLNAVPVLSPAVFDDAAAADARIRAGRPASPLDGIPYTAKESYSVRGMTVAAGSPAFEHLVAGEDAFAIERMREAGAVLIGLTTMPPMANGGMQRGVRGRAESPYNGAFLTSAFGSGSSNGSGSATGASIGVIGLGEETWSSGRAPASCNALVAYTPSRGVISMRGSWPLVPTMDVVVPHARSMADLLAALDALVAPDARTDGDFWREQPWLPIPPVDDVRPTSYAALEPAPLAGLTLAVPRMYIGADPGIRTPIATRESVLALWRQMADDLRAAGATVIETDLPPVSHYEGDRDGAPEIVSRGIVPPRFLRSELVELTVWGWDGFLRRNGDAALARLADVDGERIFPHPPGALTDRYDARPPALELAAEVDLAALPDEPVLPLEEIPAMAEGLAGLERTRELDWDQWLDAHGIDAVVMPTLADVGPADADVEPAAAALAWRNGTWVANGNLVWRHFGIPTVTVPMGTMADIGMPVGLTIAGRPYEDERMLRLGLAIEALRPRRTEPPRTPALPATAWTPLAGAPEARVSLAAERVGDEVVVRGRATGDAIAVWIDGEQVDVEVEADAFTARGRGTLAVALVRAARGDAGAFALA